MHETIIFFTLNLLLLIGDVASGFNGDLHRNKRYLVNPPGGPSRAQFIFGLGVPVVLKEQALTIGSVIKMQYLVPINSSEYTSRIYGFANTVSRYMNSDGNDALPGFETKKLETTTHDDENNSYESTTLSDESGEIRKDLNEENDTIAEVEYDTKRKRSIYTEAGVFNDVNKEESLEEAIRKQELIDQKYKDEEGQPDRMNRWDFYKILERTAERYGYSGRPCLLRTICEAADVPFTYKNGLFGEIGHILFTPSTSDDELNHHTDNEYHAAEKLGRDQGIDCQTIFPECETSVLDTFTQIGFDTLHKFGIYK